jgi:hypothetical protein
MELASQESIRALLLESGDPGVVQVRRPKQQAAQHVPKGRKLRCNCGQCHQCLDNARWERIFAEKFEDLSYYSRPVVTRASPLTSH